MRPGLGDSADSEQPRLNGGDHRPSETAPVTVTSQDQIQHPPDLQLPQDASAFEDAQFRRMLEALPTAIYATDAAGRITFYNNAAAALWGCRPELGRTEFCGSWKLYRLDGTPLPHDECPMALALKEQRAIRDRGAIAERPDGTRVPFMPYPTPLFDASGVLVGAVNMLVETSGHKRNEYAAQQLASIVESSDDAIVSKDLNGVISSWNDGAERLFGYTADEAIGNPVTMLIPPERHDEEPGVLARIRRGERVDHYETVRRRKDGSLVEISLTVSPVRDGQGRIVGASKIARDITERRRAEANKELLINEMKHRVRNTLATVHALAAQTLRSATGEERASFFARLNALAGAHELLTDRHWDRADVEQIVRRALKPFQEKHQERFLIEGAGAVSVNAGRSLLLTMALHELATNAVKYGALSNGSGRVRIDWELVAKRRLKLRWQESGGPPVRAPERKGFGSLLIERALDGEQGNAHFEFAPTGVCCTLEIAL